MSHTPSEPAVSETRKTFHIKVVGGGMSSLTFLRHLYSTIRKNPHLLPLDVEVLEAGPSLLKNSLAWGEDNLRPFHLLNVYNRELRKSGVNPHGEMSRKDEGQNKRNEYDLLCEHLAKLGVHIKQRYRSNVTDIRRRNGVWDVICDGNQSSEADFAVLAPGHWQQKTPFLNNNTGTFACPWPSSDLEQGADLSQPCGILGTSLSAIDAALTLAHAAGSFKKNSSLNIFTAQPELKFIPKAPGFKIIMLSPHGELPPVLGYSKKGIPPQQLDRLLDRIEDVARYDDTLSLTKTFDVMKEFFLKEYLEPNLKLDKGTQEAVKILQNTSTIQEALSQFHKHYASKTPLQHLMQQMPEAENSLNKEVPLKWQEFLRATDNIWEGVYNHLSAEDQAYFLQEVRPVFVKLAYGIVLNNAHEITALLNSGCLEVRELGKEYSVSTCQQGGKPLRGAEVQYMDTAGKSRSEYFPTVVRASGDDPYRLRHSSELMRNLYRSGVVRPYLVPYKDQKRGKAEFEREQGNPDTKTVVFSGGMYCRSNGTPQINLQTAELIPESHAVPDDEPINLFGMGPLATGHLPLLHGFGNMTKLARGMCETIATEIMQYRILNETVPEPPESKLRIDVLINSETAAITAFYDGVVTPEIITQIATLCYEQSGLKATEVRIFPRRLWEDFMKNNGPSRE